MKPVRMGTIIYLPKLPQEEELIFNEKNYSSVYLSKLQTSLWAQTIYHINHRFRQKRGTHSQILMKLSWPRC